MPATIFVQKLRSCVQRTGHFVVRLARGFHALRAGNRDAAMIHALNEVVLVLGGAGLVLSAI